MGRGVLVLEDPFGLEVGKFLVAFVAKKQRLAAIAHEHERVVGDPKLAHGGSPYDSVADKPSRTGEGSELVERSVLTIPQR
jgi:hypothetical protein